MQLSYKSVYHLLDRFCARRSLNSFIEYDIPENVFKASLLFAKEKEDYAYLKTMVNDRERLNKHYVFFMNAMHDTRPVVIIAGKDLTLLEFAALHLRAPYVPLHEFRTVVEAQAQGKGQDPEEELKKFDWLIAKLTELDLDPDE